MSNLDRSASAGFVSGFLAMTALIVFLAAMTLGLGPRDDRTLVLAASAGESR
jgi:hypothetical protein